MSIFKIIFKNSGFQIWLTNIMDPKLIIEDLEKDLQEHRKLLQDQKFDEGIEACKMLCERA